MKRIFIVLMAFFGFLVSVNADVKSKISDTNNPSSGAYFDFTVECVPDQSSGDTYYSDTWIFATGVKSIEVVKEYDWENYDIFEPGDGQKVNHRDGYKFYPKNYLVSAYRVGNSGSETLKLKIRVYTDYSGIITILHRASQVVVPGISYYIDPEDYKGDEVDEQGWPAYKKEHFHAPTVPDLMISDLKVNDENPVIAGTSVEFKAYVAEVNGEGVGRVSVKFLVDGKDVGTVRTNDDVGANETKTVSLSYVFSSAGKYEVKAQADPADAIAEQKEYNNSLSSMVYVVEASSGNSPPMISMLDLEIGGQSVQAYFRASDPDGDNVFFSWKMDNGTWSPWQNSNAVFFSAVAFGNHTIKAKAIDSKGLESAEVSRDFTIVFVSQNQDSIETWPILGNEIGVKLGYLQSLDVLVYVGKEQKISEMKIAVDYLPFPGGTPFNFELRNPSGVLVSNDVNSIGYGIKRTRDIESGYWKLTVTGVGALPGSLKITCSTKSDYSGSFNTVNYYGESATSGKVMLGKVMSVKSITVGLITGVCSENDIECMVVDGIVGVCPLTGTPKDVVQLVVSSFLGAGMKTVSFFNGDQETSKKANEYFKAAGLAGVGIALVFVGLPGSDDAIRLAKLSKRIVSTSKLVKNSGFIGDFEKLPKLAKRFFEQRHFLVWNEKAAIVAEKIEKLDLDIVKEVNENRKNGLRGAMKEYQVLLRLLMDSGSRFEIPKLSNSFEGVNAFIMAPYDKKEKVFDLSKAYLTPIETPPLNYERYHEIDIIVLDKETGKLIPIEVKSSNGEAVVRENKDHIKKIQKAVESSPFLANLDAENAFGVVGKDELVHGLKRISNYISSEGDSLLVDNMEPTLPIIDKVSANPSGSVSFSFHTTDERQNKGWYITRRNSIDSSFVAVSPLLLGWGDDNKGHSYEFVDATALSEVPYQYLIEQVNVYGWITFMSDTVAVNGLLPGWTSEGGKRPDNFVLEQNYPNPFNPKTTIVYFLPRPEKVTVEVYNLLGEKVVTLADGSKAAGFHQEIWHGDGFASGTYLYRMQAGSYVKTKKMTLIK